MYAIAIHGVRVLFDCDIATSFVEWVRSFVITIGSACMIYQNFCYF